VQEKIRTRHHGSENGRLSKTLVQLLNFSNCVRLTQPTKHCKNKKILKTILCWIIVS